MLLFPCPILLPSLHFWEDILPQQIFTHIFASPSASKELNLRQSSASLIFYLFLHIFQSIPNCHVHLHNNIFIQTFRLLLHRFLSLTKELAELWGVVRQSLCCSSDWLMKSFFFFSWFCDKIWIYCICSCCIGENLCCFSTFFIYN